MFFVSRIGSVLLGWNKSIELKLYHSNGWVFEFCASFDGSGHLAFLLFWSYGTVMAWISGCKPYACNICSVFIIVCLVPYTGCFSCAYIHEHYQGTPYCCWSEHRHPFTSLAVGCHSNSKVWRQVPFLYGYRTQVWWLSWEYYSGKMLSYKTLLMFSPKPPLCSNSLVYDVKDGYDTSSSTETYLSPLICLWSHLFEVICIDLAAVWILIVLWSVKSYPCNNVQVHFVHRYSLQLVSILIGMSQHFNSLALFGDCFSLWMSLMHMGSQWACLIYVFYPILDMTFF